MIAIRGATTVDNDCAEQIKERVSELLLKIADENGLADEEIICIMFSSTADIRSYYPATAAREAGFSFCSLYSSVEPDVEGSLKNCIRVMVLAEKDKKPVHIYLHGAKNLRRDLTKKINIALDGPAGSGKSTVSKRIAEELDILCLDTGAMYRACALKCHISGVSCSDEIEVEKLIKDIKLEVKYDGGVQHTFLDGADVSEKIREPHISMLASTVASLACVRSKMVELQRNIAEKTSCILDGRDIGTNVLPNAEYKFFLTASAEVRAKRRFDELTAKGLNVNLEELKAEIIKRDEQDSTRKTAPLKKADDAILVDTSEMNIGEVVDLILKIIRESDK